MAAIWKLHVSKTLVVPMLLTLCSSSVSAQGRAKKPPDVELRIAPGELVQGVPGSISFVFLNTSDHEVRIPPVSPCVGRYSGTIKLRLEFSPATPPSPGKGGGCGAGLSHQPGILEQAKSWSKLKPDESFTVSYKRAELFVFEEAPGSYELWGEYFPPKLTAQELAVLEHADISFPCQTLRSAHLQFNRPQ
jgi:hypothetical protein